MDARFLPPMKMKYIRRLSLVAAIAAISSATMPAQQQIPLRQLGTVLSVSTEPLASVAQIRALPHGRVIVHDLAGRRVLMFDSTLKNVTVIADSTSATGMAYGSRLGGLIAYRGDSTLFVDPQSLSMLVIDPNGKIVRTMSAPLPREINQLIGGQNGTPGFDAQGRLVYRAIIRPRTQLALPAPGETMMPETPDSSLVVRVDLKTRVVDTAATFRIPKMKVEITRDEITGGVNVRTTANPLPWTDDWALLADGSLAIIRGQDYRVEIASVDGKFVKGPKIPFEWQRLSDEDKTAILDSTRTATEKLREAIIAQQRQVAGVQAKLDPDAAKPGARQVAESEVTSRAPAPATIAPPPQVNLVSLSELPDYRPAIRQGAARSDADGNLWIRTSHTVNGGTEYDVINNRGELKERVLVPPGRVIAGFGPGGVVYMGVLEGDVARLERAMMR